MEIGIGKTKCGRVALKIRMCRGLPLQVPAAFCPAAFLIDGRI